MFVVFFKRGRIPLFCAKLSYWCAANFMQSHSSEIDSGTKIDTYFCVGDLLMAGHKEILSIFLCKKLRIHSISTQRTYVTGQWLINILFIILNNLAVRRIPWFLIIILQSHYSKLYDITYAKNILYVALNLGLVTNEINQFGINSV